MPPAAARDDGGGGYFVSIKSFFVAFFLQFSFSYPLTELISRIKLALTKGEC